MACGKVLQARPDQANVPTNVVVSASINGAVRSTTLTLKPYSLLRIAPVKSIVRGNSSNAYVFIDVYFTGPRSEFEDNSVVTFTASQPNVVKVVSYTISQLGGSDVDGLFKGRAQFRVLRVSRSQDISITATYKGTSATTSFTATR